jgi:CO/xanthine dehydrogenase Mo-binding subunit
MEMENGLAWYEQGSGALHMVAASQAPYGTAEHVMHMLKDSKLALNQLDYISSYTVGYGQKEHHPSRSMWHWRRCTPRAARCGWRWTAGSISSSRSSAIPSMWRPRSRWTRTASSTR